MTLTAAKRILLAVVLSLSIQSAAHAETLDTVQQNLEDGTYVGENRSDIDQKALDEIVQAVKKRNPALRLIVVAPDKLEPSAIVFAQRLHEETQGLVLVIPSDEPIFSYAKDKTSSQDSEINELWKNQTCALREARNETDTLTSVEVFVDHLENGCSFKVPTFVLFAGFAVCFFAGSLGLILVKEKEARKKRAAA